MGYIIVEKSEKSRVAYIYFFVGQGSRDTVQKKLVMIFPEPSNTN
jgi:hypothetical protein